jgi:uncharacterized protein (DUF4415 family)
MKDSYDFSKAKRGAVIPPTGKTRITLWIDNDTLAEFRQRADQTGRGYQTLLNEALKSAASSEAVTLSTIRRILREELHPA